MVAAAEEVWERVEDVPILNGNEFQAEDEEGEDEVEEHKIGKDLKLPTESEVEAHRAAGHWPYRSWCEHCVAARGLGTQHRSPSESSERKIAVLSLDYFFLTSGGVVQAEDESATSLDLEVQVDAGIAVKCLAMRDSKSKSLFAWVIPRKGKDELVVSRVRQLLNGLAIVG